MKVSDLELSARATHALEIAGIETVEQLAVYDWSKFSGQYACGAKTIAELAQCSLRFACGDMLKQAKKWDKESWAAEKYYELRREMQDISMTARCALKYIK